MSGGADTDRKRKKSDAKEAFRAVYAKTRASQLDTLTIWNAALATGAPLGAGEAKGAVEQAKQAARKCFDIHWLPSADGTTERQGVYIADLARVLDYLVTTSPTWDQTLDASCADGNLDLLLYNDEITCGNILAPLKKKKPLVVYCTFRHLWQTAGCVQSWFPLCCVQRNHVDGIADGASCLMRHVVLSLHSEKNEAGFAVSFSRGVRELRVRAPSYFVGDHDAQRATFGIKGSAGLLPCGFCSNVLHRRATDLPPGFVTISAHDLSCFDPRTDAAYTEAARSVAAAPTRKARNQKEQSTGLRFLPHGLLFCTQARTKLPFSASVTDVLHDYYANGVCSTEIGLMVAELAERGVDLNQLLEAALESSWREAGMGKRFRPMHLRSLLATKMYAEGEHGAFRGDGDQCRALLFLVHYYVQRLLIDTGHGSAKTMSYVALIEVAREIWALSARVERVTSVSDVMALAQKQARHQERFVLAYGPDFVRPKHHHRLHLPSDVLKLGFVPNCSGMERKHRELKSGKIMDGLARWVNQGLEIQNHAVSELLLRGAQAPGPWNCKLLNTTSSASLDAKRHFRDESLKRASSARGVVMSLHEGDVIMWGCDQGGFVRELVCSPATPLHAHVEVLIPCSRTAWGSTWTRQESPAGIWLRVDGHARWQLAAWWRDRGNSVWCIH